jgi:hypothetical protein
MAMQMQVASSLLEINKQMKLVWRPREENDEADALTNGDFKSFLTEKGIHFTIRDLHRGLFHRLCGSHQDFLDAKAPSRRHVLTPPPND